MDQKYSNLNLTRNLSRHVSVYQIINLVEIEKVIAQKLMYDGQKDSLTMDTHTDRHT